MVLPGNLGWAESLEETVDKTQTPVASLNRTLFYFSNTRTFHIYHLLPLTPLIVAGPTGIEPVSADRQSAVLAVERWPLILDAALGLEPRLGVPKTPVLPLDEAAEILITLSQAKKKRSKNTRSTQAALIWNASFSSKAQNHSRGKRRQSCWRSF